MMINILAAFFIFFGLVFFIIGSIGLLRLPDLYSRLHALTKIDNLGLGLLLIGLVLFSADLIIAIKLFLVWFLVLASSAISSHLIAQRARRKERGIWKI